MATLIAPCGLDCAQCEAYRHTQISDLNALEALLAKWKVEFNAPQMTIQDVLCDGCLSASGRHCGYCANCEIRRCAVERNLHTCAECSSYACQRLTGFWQGVPQAQVNLEALRAR